MGSRSRSRSPDSDYERSHKRHREKDRSSSRHEAEKGHSKHKSSRKRSRERRREMSRDRSQDRRGRSRERSREKKDRKRGRSRERKRDKSREKSRERSKERKLERSRDRSRGRSIDRSRERAKERSLSREKQRRERSRSKETGRHHHSREDKHSKKRDRDRGSRYSRHERERSSSEDDASHRDEQRKVKLHSESEKGLYKNADDVEDKEIEKEPSKHSNIVKDAEKGRKGDSTSERDTEKVPAKNANEKNEREMEKGASKNTNNTVERKTEKGTNRNANVDDRETEKTSAKNTSDTVKIKMEKESSNNADSKDKRETEKASSKNTSDAIKRNLEKESSNNADNKDKGETGKASAKNSSETDTIRTEKSSSKSMGQKEAEKPPNKNADSASDSQDSTATHIKSKPTSKITKVSLDGTEHKKSSDKEKEREKSDVLKDRKKTDDKVGSSNEVQGSVMVEKEPATTEPKEKDRTREGDKGKVDREKTKAVSSKSEKEARKEKGKEDSPKEKGDAVKSKNKDEERPKDKAEERKKTDAEKEGSDKEDKKKLEKEKKKDSKRKSEGEDLKKKHKKHKHKKHSSSSESENESKDKDGGEVYYDSDETTEQELLRKKKQLEEQLQLEEEIQQRTQNLEKEREAARARKLKASMNSEVLKVAEKEQSPHSSSHSRSPSRQKDRKQGKDERNGRGEKRSRTYSSDDAGEPQIGGRYWGGDSPKDTAHKAKQLKTSDTYWNKYADKLGIQIEDPKNQDPDWEKRREKDRKEDRKRDSSPERDRRGTEEGSRKERRKDEGSEKENSNANKDSAPPARNLIKKPVLDPITTKTGGAYIPPAKLKMMQAEITDKSSAAFQRLAWEALKKSINGLVNKVNVSNIGIIVRELLQENIVRGRGVLCRALMQAQAFSPTFTHVYAALVAIINTKFPQIGELLLKRLVIQLRRGVKKNDKNVCMSSCRFIAHLVNQQVAHEVVALEILTFLLERAKYVTEDSELAEKSRNNSCELAIAFITECGEKLNEVSPRGMKIILETFRNILHEGKLETRVLYMLEVIFAVVKDGFKDHPAVPEELDLVEENEQFTHIVELDGKLDANDILNVFKFDPEYEENEEKYKEIRSGILGEESDESGSEAESGSGSESDDEESEDEEKKESQTIVDSTETNMVAFRRTIYLTIQSSLDVDECAHKLLKGEIKPGWEPELCNMILDCCAQQRTYIKFYGLLAQRFCMINKVYQEPFQQIFKDAYETCHRLETEKLRNVTRLFAHLLFSDAISWEVLSHIHLNEDETTSSSRVFIKLLFQVSQPLVCSSCMDNRVNFRHCYK